MKNWELSFGFYPGIMLGFRTYNEVKKNNHVLYIQTAREELADECQGVTASDWDDEEED